MLGLLFSRDSNLKRHGSDSLTNGTSSEGLQLL